MNTLGSKIYRKNSFKWNSTSKKICGVNMDKLVEMDGQYRKWISEVSKRFRQSQIKVAVKVNDEMLRFYWQLGKELHDRKDSFSYGQSFYKTISHDLRKELPDVK